MISPCACLYFPFQTFFRWWVNRRRLSSTTLTPSTAAINFIYFHFLLFCIAYSPVSSKTTMFRIMIITTCEAISFSSCFLSPSFFNMILAYCYSLDLSYQQNMRMLSCQSLYFFQPNVVTTVIRMDQIQTLLTKRWLKRKQWMCLLLRHHAGICRTV